MSHSIIKRALISVTDKNGIAELGKVLSDKGVEILSTGGTGRALAEAGIEYKEVADFTGFPEIFGGRVKTLQPTIAGGILMRRDNENDQKEAEENRVEPIDLVVVNLYAFEETVAREGVTDGEAVEAIDIGGPTLIRAAAKNHNFVGVLTSPNQYTEVMEEIAKNGSSKKETLRRLAAEAFEHTACYDRAIANWFASSEDEDPLFPEKITIQLSKEQSMRYGENPHQGAAYYGMLGEESVGISACEQLHGKKLSFNNLIDADIALTLPFEFDEPTVAILKHTTPCGVGVGGNIAEAEAKARACDPLSAYGGIVGMNRECDEKTAKQISKAFTEVIVAPSYSEEALAILTKKKNQRILIAPPEAATPAGYDIRRVSGGLLLQLRDYAFPELDELKVVTDRQPTEEEWHSLKFGWIVCKYVKSNAVLFARKGATLGLGAGQMSRVDAVHVAAWKAEQVKLDLNGSILASDAYFPFADGLLAAVDAGATAVIQPGGSIRDQEVIDAANERGVTMVLTGRRHFRHA